jgi:hypothetical protein
MGKVKALCSHLCTNSSILNLQNQPSKSSVCQVKVPHVLKGAFVNLANACSIGSSNRPAEWITTKCCAGHLVDYAQSVLKKVLLSFILRNRWLDFALDCLPHIVE